MDMQNIAKWDYIYIYDFIWQSNSKSRVYPRARILMFRKLVQNGFWDTPFAPGRLPVSRAGIQSLHRTPHLWGEGRYGWGAFFGDNGEIMGKIHQWRSLTGSGYSIQWVSNGYIYISSGSTTQISCWNPKGLVRFCPGVGELGTPTTQKVRQLSKLAKSYPTISHQVHDCYDCWWYFGFTVPKHCWFPT